MNVNSVGWAMRDHMRMELTIAALTMAIQQKPPPGLIHHSDRGSQYAAADYRKLLGAAGMIQSMSRKGNCWDNAPMESYFGTLKTELVHQACYKTRDAARHDRVYHSRTGRAPSRLNRRPFDPEDVARFAAEIYRCVSVGVGYLGFIVERIQRGLMLTLHPFQRAIGSIPAPNFATFARN
jgi:transposase InsO family protein